MVFVNPNPPNWSGGQADSVPRTRSLIWATPDTMHMNRMLELAANDPLIKTYIKDLQHLKSQSVTHELGLKGPFQSLLDRAARKRGWTLVPTEASEYRLGSRSALEWLIDQYQVKGESDPNREDDPGYIVRLVGQVVRVSVETVQIVRSLPNYK
jgi:hypothetical protein